MRFRIRVTNLGTDVARNVRVCDMLPPALTLVRATVPIVYRNGRPCASIPVLTGQRQGYVTMRIARTARGVITNVAAVDEPRRRHPPNPARIRVLPAQPGRRSDRLRCPRAPRPSSSRRSRPSRRAGRAAREPAAAAARAASTAAPALRPRARLARPAPTRASAWIARLVARTPAWRAPRAEGSPRMLAPLGRWTGGPVGLLVLEARGDWLRVLLPDRPERRSALDQRATACGSSRTRWRVEIDLSARRFASCAAAGRVRRFRRSSARPPRPRRRGRFAIYERRASPTRRLPRPVRPPSHRALATCSTTTAAGRGGSRSTGAGVRVCADPLGSARSHGCVRVDNAAVRFLARVLAPGVPVAVAS